MGGLKKTTEPRVFGAPSWSIKISEAVCEHGCMARYSGETAQNKRTTDPHDTYNIGPPGSSKRRKTPEQIRRQNESAAGRAAAARYQSKVKLTRLIARADHVVAEAREVLAELGGGR